jgi:hypothetical protein
MRCRKAHPRAALRPSAMRYWKAHPAAWRYVLITRIYMKRILDNPRTGVLASTLTRPDV